MTPFEKDIHALARRYNAEVADLGRARRTLPPTERVINQAHANVKQSCANELGRLMQRHGVTA